MAQYYVWSNHEGWHLLLTDADLVQYCCGPTHAQVESLVSHLQSIAPGTVLRRPPPAELLAQAGLLQLVPAGGVPYLLLAEREDVMAAGHAALDDAIARGDAALALPTLPPSPPRGGLFPGPWGPRRPRPGPPGGGGIVYITRRGTGGRGSAWTWSPRCSGGLKLPPR